MMSSVVVLTCSIVDIRQWIRNIEQHAADSVNKILIGNKCDMTEDKKIDTERGKELAKEYSIKFFETSAKSNINVTEAFMSIAQDIKVRLMDDPAAANNNSGNVSVDAPSGGNRKQCC